MNESHVRTEYIQSILIRLNELGSLSTKLDGPLQVLIFLNKKSSSSLMFILKQICKLKHTNCVSKKKKKVKTYNN